MKQTLTLLVALLMAAFFVFPNSENHTAQVNFNRLNRQEKYQLFTPTKSKQELEKVVRNAQFFQLNPAELQRLHTEKPAHFTLQLPDAQGLPTEIVFDKKQVTTTDLRLTDHEGQPLEVQPGIHYRQVETGVLMAGVSIFQGHLSAIVTTEAGDFSLSELTESPGEYILFKQADLVEQQEPPTCTPLYSDEYKMPKFEDYSQHALTHDPADPNDPVVRVFVECDQDMVAMTGGTVQDVYEYVTTLFNFVATIYEVEDINLQLSEIMVWTNGDPYNGNLSNALNNFVQHWHEADMNFNGDLAHLLKGYSSGGLAWVDMVCNPDLPFGVSGIPSTALNNFPNYIYAVYLVSHELGHNVGSPHTHSCVWGPNNDEALDNCAAPDGGCDPGPPPANGGTIMSYCSGFNLLNAFGQEPGDLVRMLLSQKTCLETYQYYADCQMDSIVIGLECEPDNTPTDPTDDMFSVSLNVKGSGTPNTLRATDLRSGQTWLFSHNTNLVIGPFEGLQGIREIRIEDLANPNCTTERTVFPSSDCFRPDLCTPFVWENSIGGSGFERFEAISALPNGGYVGVGKTNSGEGDFLPGFGGNWDVFVQKVDENGNLAWVKQFGGENEEIARDVVGMADGGALVVGFTSSGTGLGDGQTGGGDAFALRLDANGNQVWKRFYGGSAFEQFYAVLQMPGGDFVFAGQSWSNNGDVSGNQGGGDAWLLRANSNGDIVWSNLYGDNVENRFTDIALGHGNTFALAGTRYQAGATPYDQSAGAEVTHDGVLNWLKTYTTPDNDQGVGLFANDNGGYLLLYQNSRPQVARLDANGNLVESWEVTSPRDAYFTEGVKLPDNRIAVSGHRSGHAGLPESDATSRDMWLYLLDGDGNHLFDKTYGPHRTDEAHAIAATNGGGYILAGQRETAFASNEYDTWMVKFGADICTQEGACYLSTQVFLVECSTNGTPNDLTDDVFTFDLIVNQAGTCGSGWTAGGVTGQYDLLTAMGPYPISEGPKTLVITDLDDPTISTTLTVDPPEPCSYGIVYCEDNLLENPGFETSWNPLAYWQTEGDVTASSNAHQGENAAQICGDFGNITRVLPATPGQEYTASAWVRKTSASTGYTIFTLRFLTSSWQPLLDNGTVITNTDYEQFVQTKTAPQNAAYVQVLLWKEAGGCVETDNWELCEGSASQPCEITPEVTSLGCSDNGTPNDPSDDTFQFYFIVNNPGQGTTYSVFIPETGFTQSGGYGFPYVYGGFEISEGPITVIFTDNDDPNCTASLTVTPPPPCSGDLPDFELSSFIAAQWVNGGNPQIEPYDEVVAGTEIYFPDHFANLTFPNPMPTFEVTIAAYLSPDEVLNGNDQLIISGTRTIDANVQQFGFTEGGFGGNYQIPLSTTPGEYYLIVKYDSEDLVTESDETNNIQSIPFYITSGPGDFIDLELSLAQPNPNPVIYASYEVIATLTNAGDTPATGVMVSFEKPAGVVYTGGNEYAASQGTFDPNGNQTWMVGSIPAGGTATLTVNYFLLQADAPTAYAQVSAANEQDVDSTPGNGTPPIPNEDDEASTDGGTTLLPDLTLADLTIQNPLVPPGEVLQYKFDILNLNNVAISGDFTTKAWISTDNVISPDDIQGGTVTFGNLAPGEAVYDVNGTSDIPAGLANGNYFLILETDADNDISESNEGNNLISATFTVDDVSDLPDLSGQLQEFIPAENNCFAYPGESVGFLSIMVGNTGYGPAGVFEVKFYLSTDDVLSGDDVLWSTETVPGLDLMSVTGPAFVSPSEVIPASLANGEYFILIIIDEDNDVAETDETNNNVNPFDVQIGAPDIQLLSVSGVPADVAPGNTILVQVEVQFEANGFQFPFNSSFTVDVELQDPSGDIPLGNTSFVVTEFATTNVVTKVIPATVPMSVAPGSYTLQVWAGGLTGVDFCEALGPDNFENLPITVTDDGGEIDLELSLAQPNPTPQIYSSYDVIATLTNAGTETATGVQVSFAKPNGVVYTGGNEFTASQGTFNPNGDQVWTVGSIPAGGSATLTVSYFLLQNGAPGAYAQVIAANEQDVDSTPNNGTPPTVNEDDEAATGDSEPPDLNPDLILSDLTVNNSPIGPGQVLNYNFTISNIGDGPASDDFNVKAWISTTPYVTASSIQDGIVPTGNFPAGFFVEGVPGASTLPGDLAEGQYYLILEVDADETIDESNEYNNTLNTTFIVLEDQQPGECDEFVGTGVVNCLSQDGNGQLEILYQPNGELYRSTLDGTGQVISDEFIGSMPPETDYRVEFGNELVKLVGGSEEYRVAIPQALLDQYSAITAHTEFQGGYLLFGYIANNAPPTQLEIIHTDLSFNVLQTTAIPYYPNYTSPYISNPQPVSATEAAFLLSVNNGSPGIAGISLIVIGDDLSVLTNEVLRNGVFYNTGSLLPSACGTYTLRVNTGLSYCKFGACSEMNIRKGRFVNGEFVTDQSYFTRNISSLGYGEISQAWSLATPDGGLITGSHSQLLPTWQNPINNVIHLEKTLGGTPDWEKDVTVASAGNVRWLGMSVDELVFLSEKFGGVFVESLTCLENTNPPTDGVDLELTMMTSNETPPIYSGFTVSTTVVNAGTDPATGVSVSMPKPAGLVYVGGSEWTATQGIFAPFGNEEWTVGNLAPGQSATLTLTYFLLTSDAVTPYAQVSALNETDTDSSPGNGTPPTPAEDDEAAVTINAFAGGGSNAALGQTELTGRPVQLVAVNPNPVYYGEIYLTILSNLEGTYDLECYDLAGRLAFVRDIELRKGRNVIPLDVRILESGTYYLNMRGENWRGMPLRFVVARW